MTDKNGRELETECAYFCRRAIRQSTGKWEIGRQLNMKPEPVLAAKERKGEASTSTEARSGASVRTC